MKRGNVQTTTNTLGVDSVDASLAAVTKAGGKLIMPKTPIPEWDILRTAKIPKAIFSA